MIDILYIFAVYSILGWLLEIVFFYIKSGHLQKRGILRGAYCPLYGFSMAICTLLTKGVTDMPVLCFFANAAVCTAFELMTAVIFDKLLGKKLWDYTGMRLNLNGYICLSFSAIWGVIATVCIKYLNPVIFAYGGAENAKAVFAAAFCIMISADLFSYVKP